MFVLTSSARADEPSPVSTVSTVSPWRDALWITASGALLSATLTGVFAIEADALRERAQGMSADSPELPGLSHDAQRADAVAIGLGVGAALFTAASVFLIVEGPGLFAAPSGSARLSPLVGPSTAGICWRGSLP